MSYRKTIVSLLLALPFGVQVLAQESYQITGTIKDQTNEPLIGAAVYLAETMQGGLSNFNGNFNIPNVAPGNYQLVVSLLGYKRDTTTISVSADQTVDVVLIEDAIALDDVEIVVERIIERTTISNISFGRQALQSSQGLTEDPLRTLSALPGVGRAGDLFSPSQIYVRGGAPDENLFLLDNNKVYFPYYFGGQKSIFNTDATESVELLTGGYSAAYGNHMSSVMNVKTRDGSFESLRGNASIGFYNSAALLEGPLSKGKTSFLVALRRTYLDLFLDDSADFPVPSFGDVIYQISHKIGDGSKLSFSGLSSYESMDFIAADPEPGLPNVLKGDGNNHFQSLQLQSSFSPKSHNKLSLTNTINHNRTSVGSDLAINIDAWQMGFRDDFTHFISNKHILKAGLAWQYGTFDFTGNLPLDPLKTDVNDTTIVYRPIDIHQEGEIIRSAYVLYDGNPIKGVGINAGVRIDQNPRNSYSDFSPRFAINYQLTGKSKARFSTGIYNQFPDSEGGNNLTSSRAIHYILGYEYNFSEGLYGWIEGYYKDYDDLVFYDSQLNFSNDGFGTAKGIELFIRKDAGALKGWFSYALSRSQRRIPLLDQVEDFEFDQRHIVNVVAEYHTNRNPKYWSIPALIQLNFRYADGTPYTPVVGATNQSGGWMAIDGEPLSLRNSDYLNLNFRIEWVYKEQKPRISSFVEIWNMLDNKNILGRTHQYGPQYPNNVNIQPYYATGFLLAGGFKIEFGQW